MKFLLASMRSLTNYEMLPVTLVREVIYTRKNRPMRAKEIRNRNDAAFGTIFIISVFKEASKVSQPKL
jgi:hypothetical protein